MRLTTSRREFLGSSAAATALGAVAHAHAAGSDVLRVGLIGCGGRGTGAASQALGPTRTSSSSPWPTPSRTGSSKSLDTLQKDEAIAAKIDVPPERRFVGFDAYKQVIASGVDVVLLCTPPHFRPIHLAAAVEAGKHVFAEKPVAVDAPGVRSVLATCERREGEGPVGRLRPVPALRQRLPRDRPAHPRRRDRRVLVAAGQRLPQRPIWVKPRAARLDRHELADAQLVLLHLAVGRLQRRAARPLPRRLRLGDEGPNTRSGPSAWAAGRRAPGRSTATSTTTSRSSTSTPTARSSSATCRQQPGCQNDMSAQVLGTQGAGRLERAAAGGCGFGSRPAATWRLQRPADQHVSRPSTTSCSPASAAASRSTTATTWPRARCWRSWAAWPRTPARRSPGSRR